ncbi:MAG: glycosyltransferase family 4 protein [ANME-2 cluster archaeon]|nr:glycosyltransferase family 4 protein [ANME-2 cluster archaeon]
MKILRVAADLYPSVVGGVGIHAHEMSKEQAKLGHNVIVYTSTEKSQYANNLILNYDIHRFKPIIKLFGNSIMPNMFIDLIKKKNDFDIIHAHSHLYFSTNLCALVRKIGSSPLVITNHGLNSQTAPAWFQNVYTATGAKWTFKMADKIICYTETEKREMIELGIKSQKIAVIHNGIDTDLFIPGEISTSDKKQLLWIGRFANGKGVDYLIDAFKLLKSKHPNLSLTMVGRGPEKERIEKIISDLELDTSITMKDFIPNSDLVQLYHNSSVFLLPSLEEGVPRTILEAMSCEIPVVCSELPQLVDIVNNCGFLVPTKDPRAIADKVSKIITDNTLAKQLGKNGRENVVANYSWKDTVEQTIRLYEGLI